MVRGLQVNCPILGSTADPAHPAHRADRPDLGPDE